MRTTKLSILIITLLTLLLALQSVSADSIWAPMDDYFNYFDPEKESNCAYGVENYTVYAESGQTDARLTPKVDTVLKTYQNGTEFIIPWLCVEEDGSVWGAIQSIRLPGEKTFTEDWEGKSGYVLMSDLLRSYSYADFQADHEAEIVPYNGEVDMQNAPGFTVWNYPGSEQIVLNATREVIDYLMEDPSWELYKFVGNWTDAKGNTWAAIEMQRPRLNGWINLSDMQGTTPVDLDTDLDWADPAAAEVVLPEGAEAITDAAELMGDWQGEIIYTFPEHQTIAKVQASIAKAAEGDGLTVTYTYDDLIYDNARLIPNSKGKTAAYDANIADGTLTMNDGKYENLLKFWKLDGVLYGMAATDTADSDFSHMTIALMRNE